MNLRALDTLMLGEEAVAAAEEIQVTEEIHKPFATHEALGAAGLTGRAEEQPKLPVLLQRALHVLGKLPEHSRVQAMDQALPSYGPNREAKTAVSRSDLTAMMQRFRVIPRPGELERLWHAMDKDGGVSRSSLRAMLLGKSVPHLQGLGSQSKPSASDAHAASAQRQAPVASVTAPGATAAGQLPAILRRARAGVSDATWQQLLPDLGPFRESERVSPALVNLLLQRLRVAPRTGELRELSAFLDEPKMTLSRLRSL
ncbi:unnamed protein product, partial [Chrysoparadoxa australica]